MKRIPTIEHVSVHVYDGKMDLAIDFFRTLGWELWPERHPEWNTGHAQFMFPPSVSAYVQLTEEEAQKPGDNGSASHVALTCNVEETLETIKAWGLTHSFNVTCEDVGEGKQMVNLPELFHGAFELISHVHPDLLRLVLGDSY